MPAKKIFETDFRCKWLADGCKTLEEMAQRLESTAATLRQMHAEGVYLEAEVQDDYAILLCDDPGIAKKYKMTKM